jgi:hypothetical protein
VRRLVQQVKVAEVPSAVISMKPAETDTESTDSRPFLSISLNNTAER